MAFVSKERRQIQRRNLTSHEHLAGTLVLWCHKQALVTTVYRNRRRGLKDHRQKTKYDRKWNRTRTP